MSLSQSDVAVPQAQHEGSYVLPKPLRQGAEMVVVPARAEAEVARRRAAAATQRLGERLLCLAECQQQFLAELRQGLESLDEVVGEAARARIQAAVHSSLQVLGWCDAVQDDFAQQAALAARGFEPVDLGDFCREVAGEWVGRERLVHVAGEAVRPWWGDAVRLADALHAGLALVAERSTGQGPILLELTGEDGRPRIRIAGSGEPSEDVDPGAVRGFRLAVGQLGARVLPDRLGPGGAALVLELPPA